VIFLSLRCSNLPLRFKISSPILIIHKNSGNFSQQKEIYVATTIKIVRSGLESVPVVDPRDPADRPLMAVLRNGVTPTQT